MNKKTIGVLISVTLAALGALYGVYPQAVSTPTPTAASAPAEAAAPAKCTTAICDDVCKNGGDMKPGLTANLKCFAFLACSCAVQPSPVTPTPAPTPTAWAWPACNSQAEQMAMRAKPRHKLGAKRHKPRALKAEEASTKVTGADVAWAPNVAKALEQTVGSCTGEDMAQAASNQPYTLTLGQSDAEACYSAATKIDNGCAWDAATCPGSWPPNDTGSWATSALQAATSMGWFTGSRPVVQTLQGWHDALLKGPCGFDQDWHEDDFNPDACGYVHGTGALAGGHSTVMVAFNVTEGWAGLRNSWGDWGLKGGYFRYTLADLAKKLKEGAELVCPAEPKR